MGSQIKQGVCVVGGGGLKNGRDGQGGWAGGSMSRDTLLNLMT